MTVSNNTAARGIRSLQANLVVINSTVSATRPPGGCFRRGLHPPTTAYDHVTISNNATSGSTAGGGVFSWRGLAPADVANTIAGNFGGAAGTDAADVAGPLVAGSSFNLVRDGSNMTGISDGSNGNQVGTFASPIDAHLGLLANNGGPTQTMALLAGGPALDTGSNALAADPGPDGIPGNGDDIALTVDQRGAPFARIFGTTVDIGAYEAQAFSLVVNTADDTLDAVYNPAHVSLRDALALANANPGADAITSAAALNGCPLYKSPTPRD